jgi:hypothetical protein
LDSKGLVALWREALLARQVLRGQTRGYTHHPQLARFKVHLDAVELLDAYLWRVCEEATQRGYRFDAGKLGDAGVCPRLPVTEGQLAYELAHLKAKLQVRSPDWHRSVVEVLRPDPHPLFFVTPGDVEPWERIR